ncbi:DUF5681 domain-containing protein [Altererythrobacter sp. Z27]|uniref:DUF5681 domain-containing protein n=1 Tax=Altererythrobacter sp. Z27 TaxID=3461147 RepID=UPI0040441624
MSKDYEVGYCKAPKEHRFKPGNKAASKRKGQRKKKAISIPEVLERALASKRTIKRGAQLIEMSIAELLIERIIQMVATGSSRDLLNVVALIERFLPDVLTTEDNRLEIVHHRAEGSSVPLPKPGQFERPGQ